MHGRVTKWRPPLALVLGGTLAAVLALPILGLVNFRLWGDALGWGGAAAIVGGLAVFSTLLLGYLLWRLVLRPVYALTAYARGRTQGQCVAPPTQFGTPELRRLGTSVMAMGDSLNSRAQSLQAYADHITHELKSPLTAIHGAAELLQGGATAEEAAALTRTIHDASARMQTLLDDLGHHSRAAASAGVGHSTLAKALQGLDAPLPVHIGADGTVPLHPTDLRTVLTQLLRNAAEQGASTATLSVSAQGLLVADDGPGISAGNRARVFDPFFTTRREAGGTGMGLSIVRSLVQARGGRITLRDSTSGAQFLISFD
ncbi:MAG: HAMP domain-containing sensor histidine kinase [Pseudomonadota bacterium]